MSEQESPEPRRVNLTGSASLGAPTSQARLTVRLVDNVEIEDATSLKYLRLKNGDFELYKRVFLVIDGERHEITMDAEEVPTDQ